MASRRRRRRAGSRPVRPRTPMPRKPPKVEVPETVYRRRPKHPKRAEAE